MTADTLERIVDDGLRAARRNDGSIRLIVRRLLANALAAGDDPMLRMLAPSVDGSGFTSLATGTRTGSAEHAAAANAAAITITQCDEGLREARGHPGLHAFAAALAMTEERRGTVSDLMAATAAGWEIGARLGLALGPVKPGVHPHGGWGAGAAAAAAAVAMGLDSEQTTSAVANAMSVALTGPDSSAYAGQNSHYLLPALGTANGVTAARLTAGGVQPPISAFEHFAGIAHDRGATGEPWEGDESLIASAYYKAAGLCAHALTSWESAMAVAPGIETGGIQRITVRTYAAASRLSDPRPVTRLGRQFSIPWVVASGLAGTAPESDGGETVAALARLTTVEHDAGLDARYPAARPSYLTIQLDDGRLVDAFAEFHDGDRERPFDAAGHESVNDQLLSAADDAGRARSLYTAMDDDSLSLHDVLFVTENTYL